MDMEPRVRALDPEALVPANTFRREHCYTARTSAVLQVHVEALRCLYDYYAHGTGEAGNALNATNLLSYEEWRELLGDFDIVDVQFGEREASRCFILSRMRAIKEGVKQGRAKVLQWSFEDMLEGLCRLAVQKAIPTDVEIYGAEEDHTSAPSEPEAAEAAEWKRKLQALNAADGGELMLWLQKDGASTWNTFLERCAPPGPAGQPRQPTERAVHHLCCFLIRSVHEIAPGGRGIDVSDLKLTPALVKGFARRGGKRTNPKTIKHG